ncbi:MAG: GNAT family N-acetyltransferase [Deltaproteobacteria bacterium]|jgi:RimJ/RimL family protein N-acetyltransferase|nr:GNAT family N-acetyltransferase [Deltaproteobacteria bacterium]MBW2542285.1 GNAT family N-acetyltransferase [Deltaproteobacteria bacterium]
MAGALEPRLLESADREAAVRFLSRDAVANLFLLDLAANLGRRSVPGEAQTEIVAVWQNGEIVGMAALHPTVILDANAGEEAVEAFMPYLRRLKVGLVKSPVPAVDLLWDQLSARRSRRVLVDRIEIAYALCERDWKPVAPMAADSARRARDGDLDDLVVAARESLREEDRPDPFLGDVASFRRWVHARVARARVVEIEGRVAMVGYADVQRPEGWLLQGIYTWPDCRQRGLASFGVSELCREAFRAGADHVQLAVVEGNAAAQRLYESLGFKPFAKLRTILFT